MSTKGKGYYKGQKLSFDLPATWHLLAMAEPRDVPAIADLAAAVRGGLNAPIGTAPLPELVAKAPNKKVAIISEDQTRPTKTGSIIVALLNELNKAGVPDQNVDVIIGRGTHRVITEDELQVKIGPAVTDRVRVSIHDPDSEDLVKTGQTTRGNVVWTNRVVAEAGLKIGVGTCNPHYFAGYGGGGKIVLPGVSGRETVKKNHVLIGDPQSIAGVKQGNPIWEEMLEATRIVGLDLKIDAVLNQNLEVYKLAVGEVEKAQQAAIEDLRYVYGVSIARLADVVITSAYPLETNLIQSGKSILLAETITKPGGTIILLSSCPDGAGPLMYETLKEKPEPEQIIQWIGEGKASTTGGPMATRLRALLKTKKLLVVTEGLTAQQLHDMELEYAPSVEAAIEWAVERYPRADVVVLPIGGSTFPYVEEEAKAKAA